ncbi:hypothetical protein GQX73_g552 [Xylaria multiplex]|uniref:Uncharacterized protein n=1 Tax=Xylaria multiplex TaxID=323545 RepID=A0A7C8N4C9_9PEZI|nr:hypothetical protein GQX73_g552 [Xylaria multiplex]
MAKSLMMKLLATSALLAGAAQAIKFLNDIPVDAFYNEGSEFVLEWEPEARTDTFHLTIGSFLTEPILVSPNGGPLGSPIYDYQLKDIVLDDAVKFTEGNYTWLIETIDGRAGEDWYYRFGVSYDNTAGYPRSFHVKASS